MKKEVPAFVRQSTFDGGDIDMDDEAFDKWSVNFDQQIRVKFRATRNSKKAREDAMRIGI